MPEEWRLSACGADLVATGFLFMKSVVMNVTRMHVIYPRRDYSMMMEASNPFSSVTDAVPMGFPA